MSAVEFGIRVPNSGPLASPRNIIDAARQAEAHGFDAVWVHDHLAWTPDMHAHHVSCGAVEAVREGQTPDFFDSIVTLSHLAAVTDRVRLGVACVVLPARNPVHLAKQWATLDVLSGGRTVLGIGMGSPASLLSREFEISGFTRKGRTRRMEEFARVLRAIWQEERVTFHGEFVQLDEAWIYPKPLQRQHPPLWVGGGTDPAVRRAARIGDGWIPGWQTPDEIRQRRQILIEEATRVGRNGEELPIGIEVITSIARDRATAFERGAATVRAGLKSFERTFDNVDAAIGQCIFGSVDDALRQIEAFNRAGVTHFEFRLVYSTMEQLTEQLELCAERIFPSYR